MHTFLATAYLIGESSILHLAAGPQKQLYWLNGFWKPLKCDFAENPSQSENPKGKYAFSRRTLNNSALPWPECENTSCCHGW